MKLTSTTTLLLATLCTLASTSPLLPQTPNAQGTTLTSRARTNALSGPKNANGAPLSQGPESDDLNGDGKISFAEASAQASKSRRGIIEDLQATFDRNNPNGTPANGSEDDLNGDGVINAFEEGAQVSRRGLIEDLQATFDRNNPNGTPAEGSEDDLNGDGVINVFEAGAQAS